MIVSDTTTQLQAALSRYCQSLTGNRWEAEDLVQDTWVKAIRTIQGDGHPNPEAFLLRVARNAWVDRLRRKGVQTSALQQAEGPRKQEEAGALFELEAAFHALARHLSPLQRAVFLLRDVLDYTAAETARLLETTEGAVKAALHRARHALEEVRRELRDDEPATPLEGPMRAWLHTLAQAYLAGDVLTLVRLAQRGDVEPIMAIRVAETRMRQAPQTARRIRASDPARMAA